MTTKTEQTPAVELPRDQQLDAAFADALKAEGVVKEAPAAQAPVESKAAAEPPKTAAEPSKEQVAPEPPKRSWEQLIREKHQARIEKEQTIEQYKPYSSALKVFDPVRLETLAKAHEAKDPMGILTALGYSFRDVSDQFTGSKRKEEEKPVESKQVELPPEVKQRLERVDYLEQQETERQRQGLVQQIGAVLEAKKDVFKHTVSLKDQATVLRFIEDFYRRTGELPGKDFNESVHLAAEAVENYHAEQARRYGVLTQQPQQTSVPPEAKREPPQQSGSESVPQTLSNKLTGSTPAMRTPNQPATTEQAFNDLLKDKDFLASFSED